MPPCVILAGGRAERLGGIDKCLLPLAGQPLATHILDELQDVVSCFALNANGDAARFASLNIPVIPDRLPDYGPLAGICEALAWGEQVDPGGVWVLIVSGDTPFIPRELIGLLMASLTGLEPPPSIVMPVVQGQSHPLCALWRRDQVADLLAAVYDAGLRSVKAWVSSVMTHTVPLDDVDPGHWFLNVNTQADLVRAQNILKEQS